LDVAHLTFNQEDEVALITMMLTIDTLSRTWIANTVASMHIMTEEKGLYNIKEVEEAIKIGSGEIIHATKVGRLDVSVLQEKRTLSNITLKSVCYIPDVCIKLFCLMVAMSKGCNILSKSTLIIVQKNALKLQFNCRCGFNNTFVCSVNLDIDPKNDSVLHLDMKKLLRRSPDRKKMSPNLIADKTDSVYGKMRKII